MLSGYGNNFSDLTMVKYVVYCLVQRLNNGQLNLLATLEKLLHGNTIDRGDEELLYVLE